MLAIVSMQALAASIFDGIQSTNTKDFLNEIDDINDNLGNTGDVDLMKNEVILVKIFMTDGSTETFSVKIEDSKVTEIKAGTPPRQTYSISMGECEFDAILASSNRGGAFADLYLKGNIEIKARGFLNRIKFLFVKPLMKMGFKKIRVDTPLNCMTPTSLTAGNKGVGEICNHGGDCETGNCIYVTGQGADRVYKCSCDPFKYDATPGCPKERDYPESGQGKPGDICQHGGQCETGNCIYVTGAGADRVYKCSCDPFKYTTIGC